MVRILTKFLSMRSSNSLQTKYDCTTPSIILTTEEKRFALDTKSQNGVHVPRFLANVRAQESQNALVPRRDLETTLVIGKI